MDDYHALLYTSLVSVVVVYILRWRLNPVSHVSLHSVCVAHDAFRSVFLAELHTRRGGILPAVALLLDEPKL